MQTIAMIGCGAIGEAVAGYLADHDDVEIGVAIVNQGREARARSVFGAAVEVASSIDDVTTQVDLAVDCAGHRRCVSMAKRFSPEVSISYRFPPAR